MLILESVILFLRKIFYFRLVGTYHHLEHKEHPTKIIIGRQELVFIKDEINVRKLEYTEGMKYTVGIYSFELYSDLTINNRIDVLQ